VKGVVKIDCGSCGSLKDKIYCLLDGRRARRAGQLMVKGDRIAIGG
jgi:hypothetical protein